MPEETAHPDPDKREGQALDFSEKPSDTVSPSMLANAIRRGWQVTPERKRQYFAALDSAIRDLGLVEDPEKRSRIATACAKVLVQEQDAALKDLHELEKRQRLDDGKATERIDGITLKVAGLEAAD